MKKITFLMICLLTTFFAGAQYTSMAIVGDGTMPNGWPGQTANPGPEDVYQMTSTDGINWTYDNLVTYQGSVKFRAENSWTNNWGGQTFPSGTGLFDSQTFNIPTIAGIYDVTFNSTTLQYNFVSQNLYPVISLTGPGLPGMDWGQDVDLFTTDGITYTNNSVMLIVGTDGPGEVKFRLNHDWTTNWGAEGWPGGTGVQDGASIPVASAGTYRVIFNKNTGDYSFSFPSIAVVGSGTPQGWPVDPQVDAHTLTTTDGVDYTLASITLIDGAVKFRQDNSYSVEWGATTFPEGTGIQNGGDMPCTAGTYSITLSRATGAYAFTAVTAGIATFDKSNFTVYPNPAQNNWNFASQNEKIETIRVYDILGKNVVSITPNANEINVDASAFANGIYLATIVTEKGTATIKLIKN